MNVDEEEIAVSFTTSTRGYLMMVRLLEIVHDDLREPPIELTCAIHALTSRQNLSH